LPQRTHRQRLARAGTPGRRVVPCKLGEFEYVENRFGVRAELVPRSGPSLPTPVCPDDSHGPTLSSRGREQPHIGTTARTAAVPRVPTGGMVGPPVPAASGAGRCATPRTARGIQGNSLHFPSETTSTVSSTTLMAVWSSIA
jgi:hypothetical protein